MALTRGGHLRGQMRVEWWIGVDSASWTGTVAICSAVITGCGGGLFAGLQLHSLDGVLECQCKPQLTPWT